MSLKGIRKSDGTAEYIYADDTLSEENAPGEAKAAGDRIAGVEGRITTLETAAPEIISNATKDWLDDNVTPTGSAVAIDSSLTQSGLAADAKAAGDAVNDLKSDLTPLVKEQKQDVIWSPGAYEATGYGATTSDKYKYSQKFSAGHYIIRPVDYLRSEIYTYVSDIQGTKLYGMTATNTRDFTTDSEFVITVARTDGTTLNGYEEYLNSFKPIKINENSIDSRLTYLENYQEIAFNDSYHLNSSDFIRARIDASGATITDNSHRWASTQYPIYYPFPLTLTPQSGWQIKVAYFNQDGSYSTADDWTRTGATISANQKFKITIGEITAGSDDFSIDSWVAKVDVQSFYAKQIDKNESDILSLSNTISSISGGKTSLYDLQNGRMLKIKGINHRGYNTEAPENSIPAFKLSAQHGFNYVETDVQFTEDNVPVLIHNRRINNYARLSDGSELTTNQYVDQNTLAQLMEYDWGIYYGEAFRGLKIATFEEYVVLCKKLGLHGYVEIKEVTVAFSQSNVENLVNIVDKYDMLDNITFISFSSTYLSYIKNVASSARLGFIIDTVDASAIQTAQSLKTGSNEVFVDTAHYTTEQISLCVNANLPVEIYTIDNSDTILSLPAEIVGVTSNSLIAGRIIYNEEVIA